MARNVRGPAFGRATVALPKERTSRPRPVTEPDAGRSHAEEANAMCGRRDLVVFVKAGAPCKTRTCDLLVRSHERGEERLRRKNKEKRIRFAASKTGDRRSLRIVTEHLPRIILDDATAPARPPRRVPRRSLVFSRSRSLVVRFRGIRCTRRAGVESARDPFRLTDGVVWEMATG